MLQRSANLPREHKQGLHLPPPETLSSTTGRYGECIAGTEQLAKGYISTGYGVIMIYRE